jgi:hypothetical protein
MHDGQFGTSKYGGSMRTMILGFIAATAMLSASTTFAADERNVTVVNGTGYGIKFLGFNNPGDNDWSDNELGSVLSDGSNVYVKFNNADKGCVWNFRISWADPGYSDVLWRNVNLCSIDKLTLKWDRSSNETSFIAE